MKSLILKTAAITLAIALVIGAIVLGVFSFAAPGLMMEFTASLGMEEVSGNFAYEEYQRSGDIACLARSFLIAEKHDTPDALDRFEALYGDAHFYEFCASQSPQVDGVPEYDYKDFVIGTAARLIYRRADTDNKKQLALTLAANETDGVFPDGNPLIALSAEATGKQDGAFVSLILNELKTEEKYDRGSKAYERLVEQLEGFEHE